MSNDKSLKLDELDYQIIQLLQEDGRLSFLEIGNRLGVSPNTVRSRYNTLKEAGAVSVIAIPDAAYMDLGFHAVLGLKLAPGQSEAVAAILATRDEIGWIGLVATGYDILCELSLKDSMAFGRYREQLLKDIPQCTGIDAFLLWNVPKFHYGQSPHVVQIGDTAKK